MTDKPKISPSAMKAAEEPNHQLDAVRKLWNYVKYQPIEDAAQVGLDFCMILNEYDTATNLTRIRDALRKLVEAIRNRDKAHVEYANAVGVPEIEKTMSNATRADREYRTALAKAALEDK